MKRKTLVFGIGISLVMLWPVAARANAPAPYSRAMGTAPGVVLERPSPVVVERENLEIDCVATTSEYHPQCKFVATYFLFNPSANGEELLGAFYRADKPPEYQSGWSGGSVDALLDGVDVRADATAEQIARMNEIVNADPATAQIVTAKSLTLHADPFRITVAAGQRSQLVFKGNLEAMEFRDDSPREGWLFPAIVCRHVVLGSSMSKGWTNTSEDYLYVASPLAQWAGDPMIHVTLRHGSHTSFESTMPNWTSHSRDGVTTEQTTLRARDKANLTYRLAVNEDIIHNGGPLVGIGPRLGRKELHTRFAYEIGILKSYMAAVQAETNFDNYVVAAPEITAATPNFAGIIPGLAFGVGAPIQFRKHVDPRAGIRFEIGFTFPIVSLAIPIDYYPVENSSHSHVEAAFLTQLSF
jgi:hypothetical protein